MPAGAVPLFSAAAQSVFPMTHGCARSAEEPWSSFLSRRPQLFFADAFYRSARRSRPTGDDWQLVLGEAFLQQRDEPALSHALAREPVSGALLPSLSKPLPWPGQAYA